MEQLLRGKAEQGPPTLEKPSTGYNRRVFGAEGAFEYLAARWAPEASTVLHHHGEAEEMLLVIEGRMEEERYIPTSDGSAFRYERVVVRAGGTSFLGKGGYHKVAAIEPSRTIHVATPDLSTPLMPVRPADAPLLKAAKRDAQELSAMDGRSLLT